MVLLRYSNTAILFLLSAYFFLLPGATVIHDLQDANIRSAAIPHSAWRLHQTLTPKFERWARERLKSERAIALSTSNISGTEWPLFGSVFYLWATESLQDAWEKNQLLASVAPKTYGREAIEAATRLVIDPKQASWVKIHWKEKYLTNENVFYRMLVIAALTSHARLTGDRQHLPLLKTQVESLSTELDSSPHGLLDDYPGECYPGDVLTAIAMIHKADKVLGTDHSLFVSRAIRGFQGRALDSRRLVPYAADAPRREPIGPARGCGNSYVSLFSPDIWPEQARKWYDLFSQCYWQEAWTAIGFREFPKDMPGFDWYFDVDAGPILKGYGFAACAFGVGAARVNGHFEHAYPLTTEMFVTSWPLADGTLLVPRLLSNATDAPYLGEAAILYILTRLPAENAAIKTGGSIPRFTLIVLALQLGVGLALVTIPLLSLRRWMKKRTAFVAPFPGLRPENECCMRSKSSLAPLDRLRMAARICCATFAVVLSSACLAVGADGNAYAKWSKGPSPDPGFFPLAVWLQAPSNAERYRNAGINTYVALWKGPSEEQLDALKKAGMRVICHQNRASLQHLDDPAIIGWMHGDEPDNAQSLGDDKGYGPPILPDKIVADYQRVRAADPSRPVLLNLGQGVAYDSYIGRGVRRNHPEDYSEYLKGCDIASFDIYPVNHDSKEVAGKLWFVANGVERLAKWSGGEKIVWNCLECTRIGELDRKPTPQQVRCEAWMSLIHGSRGLIYFVHQFKPTFREAALLDDPDMLRAVTALNRQITELAPVLNSPTIRNIAIVKSDNAEVPIDLMVKQHGGAMYMFAVGMRDGATTATFRVGSVTEGTKVEVLGENRTIVVNGDSFNDHFDPWDVHLYRLSYESKR